MENSGNNKSEKSFAKELIIAIISAIVTAVVTNFFTLQNAENNFVKSMSDRFAYIEDSMTAEQAIDEMTREVNRLEEEAEKNTILYNDEIDSVKKSKDSEISELKNMIDRMIEATLYSPNIVVDGLKSEKDRSTLKDSVIVYDDKEFFSSNLINSLIAGGVTFDTKDSIIYYSSTKERINQESKVNLLDTDVLYDGRRYHIVYSSDQEMISIGSQTYAEGFTLNNDYEANCVALFDLGGRYSQLSFDVGRVLDSRMNDITLQVFLDNKFFQEYRILAEDTIVHLDIPLQYSNTMKLAISDGNYITYGFVNAILSY